MGSAQRRNVSAAQEAEHYHFGGILKHHFSRSVVAGLMTVTALAAGINSAAAAPVPAPAVQDAGVHVIDKAEVLKDSATILTGPAGAEDLSVLVPGTIIAPQQADTHHVPSGLFKGEGDPLLKTALPESTITSYATEKGTQSLISITGEEAPQEYRFAMDLPEGVSTSISANGSIAITAASGETLGQVDAPWAYDANGVAVPTKFSLDGSVLVQTVQHTSSTVYPVVADPSIQWVPWPVLAVSGIEIKMFSSIAVAIGAGGAWAGCTFSKVSGVAAKIVSQICTVVGVGGVAGVVNYVSNTYSNSSVQPLGCYGVYITNPGWGLRSMPARDCGF